MSKITGSAKGQECQVRIPGFCNGDPQTTVFAHLNGGGMGMKHPDTEGAYCCSACHDVLDERVRQYVFSRSELKLMHHEGAMRTRKILIEKGLIILK